VGEHLHLDGGHAGHRRGRHGGEERVDAAGSPAGGRPHLERVEEPPPDAGDGDEVDDVDEERVEARGDIGGAAPRLARAAPERAPRPRHALHHLVVRVGLGDRAHEGHCAVEHRRRAPAQVLQEPGELMRSGHCSGGAGAVMWDSPSYVHVHARSVRALGAFDTHLDLYIYK